MLTKDSSKKEVVAEWVKELRSGDYKQGKHYLRREDEFCCLGVLCELAVKAGLIPPAQEKDIMDEKTSYFYSNQNKNLPLAVASWVGLASRYGSMRGESSSLVTRNDCGKDFSEIADVIESRPEGLFVEENGESVSTNNDTF